MDLRNSSILKIFTSRKQLEFFILGGYSGVPLFIIYSTLAAWMRLSGVSIEIITSFAIARIFYSLKVFWAPLIDHFSLPYLSKIGHRKSWMILMMSVIALVAFGYLNLNPEDSLRSIFILTLILGIASASLDIVIDAYRIENIPKEELSIAAANTVFGYRLAGLAIGAGALYMAEKYGWQVVFAAVTIYYLIGILFVSTMQEQPFNANIEKPKKGFYHATIEPFLDFFQRKYSVIILLSIIFYKLGDAMLGVVAMPFYIDLGFSLQEISKIVKIYGFVATILGCYIGGVITNKYGHITGLIICGIAQSVTNLAFIWLNSQGHNLEALMIAISVENIASGMGDTALIGYLSYLCNRHFSATQYALLSSCSGLFSHSIVSLGGVILSYLGWDLYFLMTAILALPGLCLLIYLAKKPAARI